MYASMRSVLEARGLAQRGNALVHDGERAFIQQVDHYLRVHFPHSDDMADVTRALLGVQALPFPQLVTDDAARRFQDGQFGAEWEEPPPFYITSEVLEDELEYIEV